MVIISLVSPFRKSERRRLITWVIFSAQRLCFLGNIQRVPTQYGNSFAEEADAVVIMMNPGSSVPRDKNYSPIQFSLDDIFSRNWEKEIVPTRPDNAQYQIMRLMVLNDWKRAKILNLSDLRNGNSGEFSKEFVRAEAIDSSSPHCITHERRSAELKGSLKTKSNGVVLAAWGTAEVLKNSAMKMIACHPTILGIKQNDPWYRYASPYKKEQKLEWLMKMNTIVNNEFKQRQSTALS